VLSDEVVRFFGDFVRETFHLIHVVSFLDRYSILPAAKIAEKKEGPAAKSASPSVASQPRRIFGINENAFEVTIPSPNNS
jgi:hypothetical protein